MQGRLWRVQSVMDSPSALGQRLQLKQYLGHGSYGLVVKATGPRGDVAVKVMQMDENCLAVDVVREATICKSLKGHAHVVQIQDAFVREQLMFMVFELCDQSLRMWINQTAVRKPATTRVMFEQMLSGVSFMHEHRFIHRDLKPENILLKGGVVKIADLGCARQLQGPHLEDGEMVPAAYTGGLVTLWYRAPELIWGLEAYGPAVDAWGLGTVGVELETGSAIFSGACEVEVVIKQTKARGTPTELTWPGVTDLPFFEREFPQFHRQPSLGADLMSREQPPWFYEVLEGLLVMDPQQRATPGHALEFYRAMVEEDLVVVRALVDELGAGLDETNKRKGSAELFASKKRKG